MPNFDSPSDYAEIRKTIDLLNQGQKQIALDGRYKKIILVLGNTGEGKTTFVQWLATDGETLISKETARGSGRFIITDGNYIGNSTIDSKTLIPQLLENQKYNSVFYDCPGFDDTRSTSHDIASTYFIKKVADHSEYLKMIFVISYWSVTSGSNRESFMRLIKHISDFVKNIQHFSDSIAVMITKVDNQRKENGQLIPDEKVIEEVVSFFNEVKESLDEKLADGNYTNDKNIKQFTYATTFIDIITKNDGNTYPRIGIFRRPQEAGHINKAPLLNEEKRAAQIMVNQELTFVKKPDNNFGYTVSDKSKNDLHDLVDEVNRRIWKTITDVSRGFKQYYKSLIEPMSVKVRSFAFDARNIETDLDEARRFNISIVKGVEAMSKLKDIDDRITLNELANRVNSSLGTSVIPTLYDSMNQVSNEASYLEFFKIISNQNFYSRPWGSLFQNTVDNIEESTQKLRKDVANTAEKLLDEMASDINVIAKEICSHGQNKTKTFEYLQGINELKATLSNQFNTTTQILAKEEQADGFVDKIKNLVIRLKFNTTDVQTKISHATNLEKRLKYLNYIGEYPINLPKKIFVDPFNDAAQHLEERRKWNEFLSSLSAKLSEEQFQKNASRYNVANIEDWGYPGKPQGLILTASNIDSFLEKIKQHNIKEYDAIKSAQINESQFRELNEVLKSTLGLRYTVTLDALNKDLLEQNPLNQNPQCTANGELTITGNNIKLSDFIFRDGHVRCKNGTKVKSLKIFAINQVTIDTDLSAVGEELQVIIIAPKWVVDGRRNITLDGAPAKILKSLKPHLCRVDSNTNTCNGLDGQPGLPGGPAGNFFGIGQEFVNGAHLTITANGGDGGAGQDGGDGAEGSKGKRADLQPELFLLLHPQKEENFLNAVEVYKYDLLAGSPLSLAREIDLANLIPRIMWVNGTPGQNGGNGGNGGKGGEGGYGGKIIIRAESSGITTSAIKGAAGQGGKGGRGGLGGQYGDQTKVLYCKRIKILITGTRSSDHKGDNGVAGTNNFNANGRKKPELPPPPINQTAVITEYKSYLQAALNDKSGRYNKDSIAEFYNRLVGNHHSRQKRSAMKQLGNRHHLPFAFLGTNNQTRLLIQNRASHRGNGPHTNTSLFNISGPVDVIGNLALAQLITAKINGTNTTLPVDTFVSPEEERNVYIDELAQHVTLSLRLHEDGSRQDQGDAKGDSHRRWFDYFW